MDNPKLEKILEKAANGSLSDSAKTRILKQLKEVAPDFKEHIEEHGCTDEQCKSGFFTHVASLLKGK